MATLDFSSMVDPETPKASPVPSSETPAGPVEEKVAPAEAGLPQDQPEAPKPDGSIFSKDLFSEAAGDLIKAPLAGVERAGRGLYETGRAIAGAVGIDTPKLPPPYFEEPKAFPAQLLATATQFGIGFVAGGAVTKGLGVAAKLGTIGNDVAAQGIGTALVADPHAPTLSNLIEQFPALHNPISDYLSAKPDDGIAFGKFKAAVQDMAAQVPLSLITKVVRGMKAEKVGDVKTADAMKAEVAQEVGITPKPAEPSTLADTSTQGHVEGSVPDSIPVANKQVDSPTQPPHIEVKNQAGQPVFSITKEQADLFSKQVTAKVRSGNTEDLVHDLYSMVNHEKMDSQQTVQQVVVAMSNIIKKPLDTAGLRTEGVMTNKMTRDAADILGQDPAAYTAKLRVMAQHAEDMPSMIAAGNGYIQAFADDIASLSSKIHYGAASPEDELRLASQINSFSEVFGLHASLRTGAARATQAGNIRTGLGANVSDVADAVEAAGGSDAIRQVANRIALAGTDRKAVVRTLETSWGRKLLDTHNEFWINGVLSGVKTHVVNVSSNAVNSLITPFNQVVGGAINRDTRAIKDGVALYRGLASQFTDGVEFAWKAFKTDTAILDPAKGTNELWGRAISSANYKMDGDSFIGQGVDFLGKVIRFPGRFLTAEDEFFKTINYRAKLKVNASNEAEDLVSAGKLDRTGVEQYVENRFQAALSPAQQDKDALTYAQQATFTQKLDGIETWSGNRSFGAGLQTLASNHPILRGTILPFIKVPTNIMRTAVDHSLLAVATKRFHADIAAGGARSNMAKGKLATGTMMAVGATILAIQGKITGAAFGDKDMQARQRETGWQPYSITNGPQAGKDQWFVSLNRLDPWGMMFGLAGDFHQTAHHLDEGSRDNFATALGLSIANNISSKSYLQGLTEISSLIGGTGYNKENAVERFIQQRVGSYVPAYANLWTGNEDVKALRHWYDGALAKIPGYSKTVETLRDYLTGEKTVAPDGYPWNALNPFTVSKGKGNAVRDELKRLTLSSAESKFAPPSTKLGTLDLANIKNASGQSAYDRWTELIGHVKVHGKTFEENLHDLMQTDRYKNGTDGISYYAMGSRPAMIKAERKNHEDLAQRTMLKEFTSAQDADGAPVDLRQALQTDARNKTAERFGKADKLKDISNLQQ